MLPAQLHLPLHPHLHPEAGSQGEVRHRGLHRRGRGVLHVLRGTGRLPDRSRDQGEGRPQLRAALRKMDLARKRYGVHEPGAGDSLIT